MKTCSKCGQRKPMQEFSKNGKNRPRRADCRSCNSARSLRYYHADRERGRERNKQKGIRRYGITVEQYEEKAEEQGGVCAICGNPPKAKRLAIDHDHRCCPDRAQSCGRCVRGLLCAPCNTRLGHIEDEGWLAAARRYLEQHNTPLGGRIQ